MGHPDVSLHDLEELGALAVKLGLDRESVFDSDFWAHFTQALEARRQGGRAG